MKAFYSLLIILLVINIQSCQLSTAQQNSVSIMENNKSSIAIPLVYKVKESKSAPAGLIILMHGYGSNEADLFALTSYFPENYTIVSLQAPTQLATNSYQWFTIINGNNLSIEKQALEVRASENLIIETIELLQEKYNIPSNTS